MPRIDDLLARLDLLASWLADDLTPATRDRLQVIARATAAGVDICSSHRADPFADADRCDRCGRWFGYLDSRLCGWCDFHAQREYDDIDEQHSVIDGVRSAWLAGVPPELLGGRQRRISQFRGCTKRRSPL